jgi:hypothetical protein
MDLRLSPVQVRNRLILAARRIVADHTPDAEGICPVCGVLHCEALAVAFGYLARVDRPEPPVAVEIHRRAAVPPPGITAAELRIAADSAPDAMDRWDVGIRNRVGWRADDDECVDSDHPRRHP